MKVKKHSLVLAMILVLAMSVSGFAATNPFSDVPAHHWAYDSVTHLAAVGLVEGYPDGTFGGNRTMTRYEAAMVFARALARLENLVESQVISNTAGVKEQIVAEVYAELEKMTDELVALIKEEFAKLEIPVVEVPAVKEVVELQPIERPFVMTAEAEAVITELVSKLTKEYLAEAADLAKETIVETGVIERVVVEDVDEEVVRNIAKEVLAASLSALQEEVKSNAGYVDMVVTKINDRIGRLTRNVDLIKADQNTQAKEIKKEIKAINGLIAALEGNVNALQQALDAEVVELSNALVKASNEFASELNLLGVRVDELELLYANLEGRVTEVEDAVAALEASVSELDQKVAEANKVKLSGSLSVNGSFVNIAQGDKELNSASGIFGNYADKNFASVTKINSKLSAQIDDGTVVNLILGATGDFPKNVDKFDKFVLEVVSDTPVKRLAIGTIGDDVPSRFDGNVVNLKPHGAVVDLGFGGLKSNLLLSPADKVVALRTGYQFIPALGVELTGASVTGANLKLADQKTVAGRLYGQLGGFDYSVKVALDHYAKDAEKNLLVDVKLGANLGILDVDANWAMAGENFGTSKMANKGFINATAQSKLQLDASAKLFGVNLGAGTYVEKDNNNDNVVNATMINAAYDVKFLLPLNLSARYGWRMVAGSTENDVHSQLKIGTGVELFGIDVNGSFTYVNNYINGDWRNPGSWKGQDANIIALGVGYDTNNFGGAKLELGYNFELAIPREETAKSFANEATHVLTAGYGISDGMKLNMSAKRINIGSLNENTESTNVDEIKAGLEIKF